MDDGGFDKRGRQRSARTKMTVNKISVDRGAEKQTVSDAAN